MAVTGTNATPLVAVLILAGGAGRRLGGPKAWLDWDGKPLLLGVIERLASLAPGRPLVVGSPGVELPAGDYTRLDDARAGEGPLAGLAAGLGAVQALQPKGRVAVSACDCPFADSRLYRFLAELDDGSEAIVPVYEGRLHPLSAVWRARAADGCRRALGQGERRVRAALEELAPRLVPAADFPAEIDPSRALFNLNDRRDLLRARAWRD